MNMITKTSGRVPSGLWATWTYQEPENRTKVEKCVRCEHVSSITQWADEELEDQRHGIPDRKPKKIKVHVVSFTLIGVVEAEEVRFDSRERAIDFVQALRGERSCFV